MATVATGPLARREALVQVQPVRGGIVIAEDAEPLPFAEEGEHVRLDLPRLQSERVAAEVQDLCAVRPAGKMELGAARGRGIGGVARARGLEREIRVHSGRTG